MLKRYQLDYLHGSFETPSTAPLTNPTKTMTETGLSLVPFIVQLTEWAQKHMKSIVKHREEFEAAEEE